MRKKHPYIRLFRLICLSGYVEQICFTLSHVLYHIIKYYPSRKAIKYCSGGDIFFGQIMKHTIRSCGTAYIHIHFTVCAYF